MMSDDVRLIICGASIWLIDKRMLELTSYVKVIKKI